MKIVQRFNSVERKDIVEKSQACLWSDEGKIAKEYLIEQRKVSEDILKKFCVGYLPVSLNHQLAGRVIMPLFDYSGSLVSITTRIINDNSSGLPKYWHESYQKSFYVYGLYESKKDIFEYKYCIVCEGQIDVLKMHDCGFVNTVGACANKLSEIQIASLRRVCSEFVILFDADVNSAGQKGAEKIIESYDYQNCKNIKNGQLNHYLASAGLEKFTSITLEDDADFFSNSKKNIDPDEFLIKYGKLKLSKLIDKSVVEMRTKYVS